MANKAFEIQESTLRIGGVDLQAGATTIVIPGVTQATTYLVEEVDETGDQTYSNFPAESEVVVIDKALYDIIIAEGSESGFADYTATTDDDGEIDEIEVNGQGTYSAANADRAGLNDMYAYIGAGSASDRPLVPSDWIQIPFRPKMRAGEVVNVGGGGSGGVVERSIDFPEGAAGDTAGTLALNPIGNLYICKTDWVDYSDYGGGYGGLETSEDFLPGQTGFVSNSVTMLLADVPQELLYILQNVVTNASDWSIIMEDEGFGGEQTCTSVGFNVDGNPSFSWPYRNGTDPTSIPEGSGFTVAYSGEVPQPAIWQQITLGNPLGDLTIEFGNVITNDSGDVSLAANDDIRLDANDEISIRTSGTSSGNYVEVVTGYDSNDQHRWKFDTTGNLTLPQGGDILDSNGNSVLGGAGGSGELYIMANIDGNIVTSTNGVDWSDPQPSGMVGINKVEIHNNVIVYIPGSEDPISTKGLFYSTELGTVTVCTGTDVSTLTGDDLFWNEVHYFSGPDKWVAVGYDEGTTNNVPVVAHSDNGITWTVVFVDDAFVGGFNTTESDWELRDVAWLEETNQYIITSNLNGSNFGGIFLTADITTALDGTNHVAIAADTDEVAPWSVTGFGGPPGYVFLTEDDSDAVWFGYGSTVGNYQTDFDGTTWADAFSNQIGYVPDISEVAYRDGNFIAVTPDGQVITPNGMGYTVSVPLPYTNTQISITNANPAVITYGSGSTPKADNEKIEITLAGEYNGTYYVNTSTNVLYTDLAMTTALDASGFAAFTSGTLTYSHGQYFDAAGASNSYYYIANDDEQIFRSSNGITWTQQADFTGDYFNDFAHGSWGSSSDANAVSYTPDDTDNWEDPAINTVQAALDELAARVTALQNFEIDGGNANTPALGEILIDGNGA